jgi:hypothetical protein
MATYKKIQIDGKILAMKRVILADLMRENVHDKEKAVYCTMQQQGLKHI